MKSTKKKTIHVVSKYFYPVVSGIEVNLLEIYSYLVKSGWDVTVHCSKNDLTDKNVLANTDIINGIKVKRYSFRLYGFIPKINYSSADIVSLHNFNISPHVLVLIWIFMMKILRKKKFLLILSPHSGFNPDFGSMPKSQALLKSFINLTLGRILINFTVDGIRAISRWEEEEMVNAGINKKLIRTIGNGTHEVALTNKRMSINREFKNKVKIIKPYIVQIGRIHPIKNYEAPIRALSRVPERYKLLIIGPIENEQYSESLKVLINDLGLRKRVVFLRSLSDAEKYYTLANAEMMVHMSRHEGYCNAVHEGMSQGLVCIVSNTTALPYLVKNNVNGYCLDPYDFDGISEKINYVLKNKNSKIIKNMQKRNKEFARNNSWENVTRKVEDFYLSIKN